jgi:hypothetical protein
LSRRSGEAAKADSFSLFGFQITSDGLPRLPRSVTVNRRKLDPMDTPTWRERLIGSSELVPTHSRVKAAYAVAIATDVLQFALGPFGWAFTDEILDVIALIATTRLIGFHPLLLPTFILEFIPVIDVLPTWTACVALVLATRNKQSPPATHGDGDDSVTIDVKPTSVR